MTRLSTIFLTLLLSFITSSLAIEELCGDGDSIEEMGDTVRVRPAEGPYKNFRRLTRALRRVPHDGMLILCEGNFHLGDSFPNRHSVVIRKGVTIEGVYVNETWQTTISGGGVGPRPGLPDTVLGPLHVKALLGSVSIRHLWLRDWYTEAVYITAVQNFAFTYSKLSHPRIRKRRGFPLGFVDYIHGIFAIGQRSRGTFVVQYNEFDMRFADGDDLPNDSQPCCMYGFPPTSFELIEIQHNQILTQNEGIEVFGNTPLGVSEIYIRNNTIDMSLGHRGWPDNYGLLVSGNHNTRQLVIEDNSLTLSNGTFTNPVDFEDAGVMSLTGSNLFVRNNEIQMNNFGGKVFRFGNLAFGWSITDSLFENNTISGSYKGVGLDFTGGVLNRSRRNVFRLGETFAAASTGDNVLIRTTKRMCGNTWEGTLGVVDGDLDQPCHHE